MSLLSAVLQEANKATSVEYSKLRDELLSKVNDTIERIEMLSCAIEQYLIDTFVIFSVTKSLEQLNFKNRKANIELEYQSCMNDMKTIQVQFESMDYESDCNWVAYLKHYDYFSRVCTVAEGKSILERANHEFKRFNYSEAMLAIENLKKKLKTLEFEGDLTKVVTNMNAQAENQLALYTAHLSIEWEDIFTWSQKKGLHFLTYSLSVQQSDPIRLQKVLMSLYVTNRINAELGLFSHFFLDKLLHDVIRHNCDIFTEDHIGAIIFNIKINMNDKKKPSYQTVFNNLTAIFEFLQSTLGSHFELNLTFIEVLADSIRNKFFNIIIEDCIRSNLPSCDSSYQEYKNIVVELDAFNKFLVDQKFVEASKSPLNKYIDDTECVLYNKKCDKLLYDVRKLLTESLSYGTVTVGTSVEISNESINETKDNDWDITKPIFLPKCVISQNVEKTMMVIVEHLEESAKLPQKYSFQLVGYVRDIAVMYQCVVPRKFKVNLECCPADIALFFNNCFYLAHGLVGPPWCTTLPKPLVDRLALVLLESIQDLRVLGLEKISLYLQKQKCVINQSIEAKDPQSPWTNTTFEQFDCAINNAITLMSDLKASWLCVLPSKMYEMSLCTLAQVLCQAVLDRVFGNSKPVGEELVFLIAVRVEDTVLAIEALFQEQIQFDTKISNWAKFTKLPTLLKGQLLEISQLWSKTEQLKFFTCEEVRQVVKMRFPDDKYRLRILKEIQ